MHFSWQRKSDAARFKRQRRFLLSLEALEPRLALTVPIDGWQLVFQDEFSGTALNNNVWNVLDGRRTDAFLTPEAVEVRDGSLEIATFTEAEKNYTAVLNTRDKFLSTYGYYEARIEFNNDSGMWSAFWLHTPTVADPLGDAGRSGTEVDIVENRVADELQRDVREETVMTVHWDGYREHHKSVWGKAENAGDSLQGNFHTYGVLWTPEKYDFYLDGEVVWTADAAVSQRSLYLNISSHVNGQSWVGAIPAEGYGSREDSRTHMKVDYIRVWQSPDAINLDQPPVLETLVVDPPPEAAPPVSAEDEMAAEEPVIESPAEAVAPPDADIGPVIPSDVVIEPVILPEPAPMEIPDEVIIPEPAPLEQPEEAFPPATEDPSAPAAPPVSEESGPALMPEPALVVDPEPELAPDEDSGEPTAPLQQSSHGEPLADDGETIAEPIVLEAVSEEIELPEPAEVEEPPKPVTAEPAKRTIEREKVKRNVPPLVAVESFELAITAQISEAVAAPAGAVALSSVVKSDPVAFVAQPMPSHSRPAIEQAAQLPSAPPPATETGIGVGAASEAVADQNPTPDTEGDARKVTPLPSAPLQTPEESDELTASNDATTAAVDKVISAIYSVSDADVPTDEDEDDDDAAWMTLLWMQ